MMINDDLSKLDWTDKSVLSMTDEQLECSIQSERIYRFYCQMLQPQNAQHKAQSAHDLLAVFNDMQARHPAWVKSINRYLASTGARDVDVKAWARQAWKVYREWTAGKPSDCRDMQPETDQFSHDDYLP